MGGESVIKIIKLVLLAFIISLVSVRPALAGYIDPNTGGLLFQMLAVGFAFFSGIMLFFSRQIRVAFARVRRFLRDLLKRSSVTPLEKETPKESS
jgi:hypothetical protein